MGRDENRTMQQKFNGLAGYNSFLFGTEKVLLKIKVQFNE